ncbi:MAG: type IX secretion system sortase PorU, partial [Bacteroidales bacterium]|nr:type IX secretion system sortase PorU [Bacteroidales bacterium]
MKKHIILFVLVLFTTVLFAQTKLEHIKINWTVKTPSNGSISNQNSILYFDGAKNMGSTGLLPFFYLEIPLESTQTIKNIQLINRTEESFSVESSFLQNIQLDLNNTYEPKIYIKNNNGKVAVIYFSTIKQNILPSVLDKLLTFDLTYDIINNPAEIDQNTAIAFDTQSVMKDGDWYQFKVSTTGVYKLSYEQLNNVGINFDDFSSSQIKMYGFGGMLAEFNNDFRHADIPEIALRMFDGNDGSFDPGDYLLFYAEGPDSWYLDEDDQVFHHRLNIYSRESYYYVVMSNGDGLRMEETSSLQNANYTVNSFTDYDVIEDEIYNLINSGRRWFGDKFEFTTDYQYEFKFENIISGSPVYLKTTVAARSLVSSRFTVNVLDQSKTISVTAIPSGSYASYAVGAVSNWDFNYAGNGSSVPVSINYNQPLTGSVGWLDYIEVNVERAMTFSGNQMAFRNYQSVKPGRITEFNLLANSSEALEIWEITIPTLPAKIKHTASGNSLQFTLATEELREFIAYKSASAISPEFVGQVENQNLHAEINHDYIIITYPEFLPQAEELAQFHRDQSNLDVFVTTLQPIYNEFSSGKQDVSAIRDFIRCVYNNSSEDRRLKYLLLFGDASMDYLNRDANFNNMVPTWESYESFNPISSIATDDFFGFLDENEGDLNHDEVNIGIGRFTVVNSTEAQEMVDKVKHYKSNHPDVMADWRNTICFIADDEDGNLHLDQANDLSILVDSIYPTANLDKIYVDAYTQESTPAGQRYPKVNEAINERVEKGSLIISYTGHGGEVGWGQERFLDIPDILSWTNYDNLPVFLTATCEFARYDDPARVSAGEYIFLNSEGGGIALFTTARATYAGSNFVVSTNFYKAALTKVNGEYLRMGDIIRATKLASGSGVNVQKFILLGDPALSLNMPKYEILISSVYNNSTEQETDTIKALSNITIKGSIYREDHSVLTSFNGDIYPTIYDKPSLVTTLGNDPGSSAYTFELQKNILYKGKADVVDGEFEFTFIVPKDIAYKYGEGKISCYAENGDIDATGYDNEIIIGGYEDNVTEDDQGPEIQLYINNDDFVSGGITDENPVLIAYVTDDNGINTTGNGIGHDISATLDGDDNNVKILNDYYVADANSYKSGAISFPYFKLEDGSHTLELKVWDIHNNSNKASINFIVASSATLALEQLFNYPNPVSNSTTFSFEHNQSNQNMEIIIDIYGIDGKRVTRIEEDMLSDGYRNNDIEWDVTDER